MNPSFRFLLTITLVVALAGCAPATTPTPSPTAAPTSTPKPTATPTALPTPTPAPPPADGDIFLFAAFEGGSSRLFTYSAAGLRRLTPGGRDERAPALSPSGDRLAFATRADGFWDLYLLDLRTGAQTRLTNTAAYDSSPAWSPDAQWLAYESYVDDNLEILVLSVPSPDQPPIRLTHDPAIDSSPAWSPGGRQIAFVSTRAGQSDIWLADLDYNTFTNLSRSDQALEAHPAWSPDGRYLAWGSTSLASGLGGIYLWDASNPSTPARWVGAGDWPAWDASGQRLVTRLRSANREYLTAYRLDGTPVLPPLELPGPLRGLAWPSAPIALPAFGPPAAPLWQPAASAVSEVGRWTLVELPDVQAPYPQLHDLVDESFAALRARLIADLGWDALANLQYAYVPLSAPLDPGLGEDWLYTGRAFALNPLLINAGWMAVLREDIGPQTYWRVYLRAARQDGSQGEPLPDLPWDLAARYNLDPRAYDQGGAFAAAPVPGYWVDLTTLAGQYGWERLPALPNWRTYFVGARAAEFALTGGLDWRAAMLELYPAEALFTPTPVRPPTATPTRSRP